jgi:hypothetical protein
VSFCEGERDDGAGSDWVCWICERAVSPGRKLCGDCADKFCTECCGTGSAGSVEDVCVTTSVGGKISVPAFVSRKCSACDGTGANTAPAGAADEGG